MKTLIILIILSIFIYSCKKDDTKPSTPPSNTNNDTTATHEINYFDWIPDTLVIDSFLVDIDNDSIKDLKFLIEKVDAGIQSATTYYNYFAKCISINNNLQISLGVETFTSSDKIWSFLNTDTLITNNLTWDDMYFLKGYVVIAGFIGEWDTDTLTHEYIGLKMTSGQSTYFGWLKANVVQNISLDKEYSITCKEYAMSKTDNFNIKVGQKE